MKGDEKLWGILNDKLDMLRASNRLPEAIRVAQTALDLAQRAFPLGTAITRSAWKSSVSFMTRQATGRPPNLT